MMEKTEAIVTSDPEKKGNQLKTLDSSFVPQESENFCKEGFENTYGKDVVIPIQGTDQQIRITIEPKGYQANCVGDSSNGSQTCAICNVAYSTSFVLETHMLNEHPVEYGKVMQDISQLLNLNQSDNRIEMVLDINTDGDSFECTDQTQTLTTNIPEQSPCLTTNIAEPLTNLISDQDQNLADDITPQGQTFRSSVRRKIRKRANSGEKLFKCNECGKSFSWKKNLRDHMRIHSGVKPFQCNYCDMKFYANNLLLRHMKVHTAERPFQCSECVEKFRNRRGLQIHMKKIHTGGRSYQCSECGRRFSRSDHLRRHLMMSHTGERPFQCTVCGKGCVTKSSLLLHIKVHTGEKPFKCDHCDWRFVNKSMLNSHVKRKHSGDRERSFPCDRCEWCFYTKSELKLHYRTHTGEKPYQCHECGEKFTKTNHLQRHMRSHKLDPLLCHECGKNFNAEDDFRKHIKIHAENKPFKCDECGLGFNSRSAVDRHKTIHPPGEAWFNLLHKEIKVEGKEEIIDDPTLENAVVQSYAHSMEDLKVFVLDSPSIEAIEVPQTNNSSSNALEEVRVIVIKDPPGITGGYMQAKFHSNLMDEMRVFVLEKPSSGS